MKHEQQKTPPLLEIFFGIDADRRRGMDYAYRNERSKVNEVSN